MGWQDAPTVGGWQSAPIIDRKKTGRVRSGALGLVDSATFGFADEINAGMKAVGGAVKGKGFKDTYRKELAKNRQTLKNASADNPGTFLTGQVFGAFVPVPGAAVAAGSRAGRAVAAGAAKVAAKGKAGRAAVAVAPDVARGAAYGAGSAEGDRLSGAAEGAAFGAAGHAAGRVAGKVAGRVVGGRPKAKPDDVYGKAVETLDNAGIVMTPGRRAGQSGFRRGYEESFLGSLPYVKAVPRAANVRSVKQLNVAAYNSVLEPIGIKWSTKKVPPGRESVSKLQQTVYGAYDASVAPLVLQADQGLATGIQRIKASSPGIGADPAKVDPIVDQFTAQLQNGPLSGGRVRDVLQDLREEASGWARSSTKSEQKIGAQLWALHDEMEGALLRQNPADAVHGFKQAREAVTRLKRVERAVADTKDGIATPGQLKNAVHGRGYGTNTSNLASGNARMQELADAAALVLPDVTPNSATPERSIAALLLGGPSALGAVNPWVGGAAAVPLGGYAPGITDLLQNFALHRPDVLRRLGTGIDQMNPALGTAGTMGAVATLNQ